MKKAKVSELKLIKCWNCYEEFDYNTNHECWNCGVLNTITTPEEIENLGKKNRVIPSVPPEDREKLNEGVDEPEKDIWVPSRELRDVIKTDLLLCSCQSDEHQVIIHHDLEDKLVYLHIHLTSRRFLSRLKYGIKYIFGYQCRYGAWDEIILTDVHSDQFQKIYKTLKGLNKFHKPIIKKGD